MHVRHSLPIESQPLARKQWIQRRRWQKYVFDRLLLPLFCSWKVTNSLLYDILKIHVVQFLKPKPIQEDDDSLSDTTSIEDAEQRDCYFWMEEQNFVENSFNEDMFGIPHV